MMKMFGICFGGRGAGSADAAGYEGWNGGMER
jgi:hypothetical protein